MQLFRNMQNNKSLSDQEMYILLDQFTDASLEMPMRRVRDLFTHTQYYPVVFGYFLGAMDAMKDYSDLNERHIKALFRKYLSYSFRQYDKQKEKELYQIFMQLRQTSEGQHNMYIGCNTFKKWLENKAEVIPDLNRLIFSTQVEKGML
jgi:hypothetical protein